MTGSLAGKRILVVEDEFFIAADLMRAIEEADGVVVGPVEDLTAGVAVAAEEAIDAVLLDINLGGSLSYPIADVLLERNIAFVFLTGYEQGVLPDGYAHVPRVAKPFPITAILAALDEMVAAKAAP